MVAYLCLPYVAFLTYIYILACPSWVWPTVGFGLLAVGVPDCQGPLVHRYCKLCEIYRALRLGQIQICMYQAYIPGIL